MFSVVFRWMEIVWFSFVLFNRSNHVITSMIRTDIVTKRIFRNVSFSAIQQLNAIVLGHVCTRVFLFWAFGCKMLYCYGFCVLCLVWWVGKWKTCAKRFQVWRRQLFWIIINYNWMSDVQWIVHPAGLWVCMWVCSFAIVKVLIWRCSFRCEAIEVEKKRMFFMQPNRSKCRREFVFPIYGLTIIMCYVQV